MTDKTTLNAAGVSLRSPSGSAFANIARRHCYPVGPMPSSAPVFAARQPIAAGRSRMRPNNLMAQQANNCGVE